MLDCFTASLRFASIFSLRLQLTNEKHDLYHPLTSRVSRHTLFPTAVSADLKLVSAAGLAPKCMRLVCSCATSCTISSATNQSHFDLLNPKHTNSQRLLLLVYTGHNFGLQHSGDLVDDTNPIPKEGVFGDRTGFM